MKPKHPLRVLATQTPQGIRLHIEGRDFLIEFPKAIWSKTPTNLKRALTENLAYGNTHFLPLLLGETMACYNFPVPLLESFLFKNQLYDMTCSEKADGAETLSYFRAFYNLDFEFEPGEGTLPEPRDWPKPKRNRPSAIVPFSFGKESLTTVALCLELGIQPVLVYSQEPSQPHEEDYKRAALKKFGRRWGIQTYFVRNDPGLFRYGKAFGLKNNTEIGWGSQTTLLALMALPFARVHGADLILFGSEYANNESELRQGWKLFPSFDQTSQWTAQQNTMIRILTGGKTHVKSSLEPVDEVNIFYILHHRYPEIGQFQFSCSAEKPLYKGSQWCHECYKCVRMFLFARATGIDPYSIGFKKDLLLRRDLFAHYFGDGYKSGSMQELDFAFYAAYKRGVPSPLMDLFKSQKLPYLKPWAWYRDHYTHRKPDLNLPEKYCKPLHALFDEELRSFSQTLPK